MVRTSLTMKMSSLSSQIKSAKNLIQDGDRVDESTLDGWILEAIRLEGMAEVHDKLVMIVSDMATDYKDLLAAYEEKEDSYE